MTIWDMCKAIYDKINNTAIGTISEITHVAYGDIKWTNTLEDGTFIILTGGYAHTFSGGEILYQGHWGINLNDGNFHTYTSICLVKVKNGEQITAKTSGSIWGAPVGYTVLRLN